MKPDNKANPDRSYAALQAEALKRRKAFDEASGPKIHIGMATCGIASGALETKATFKAELAGHGLEAHIHSVGCIGHCQVPLDRAHAQGHQ